MLPIWTLCDHEVDLEYIIIIVQYMADHNSFGDHISYSEYTTDVLYSVITLRRHRYFFLFSSMQLVRYIQVGQIAQIRLIWKSVLEKKRIKKICLSMCALHGHINVYMNMYMYMCTCICTHVHMYTCI